MVCLPVVTGAVRARREILAAWTLVALAWVYVFPYSQRLNNPNERTRVLQARALADGTFAIGEQLVSPFGATVTRDLYGDLHPGLYVNDVAVVCTDPAASHPHCAGPLYPAKAPGAALLGAPIARLGEQLGWIAPGTAGEPALTRLLRLTVISLPILLALLLMAVELRRRGVPEPLVARVLLAVGLGTTVFSYGLSFTGHAVAGATLLVGAFLLRGRPSLPRATLGGFVAASTVLFEYHGAIAVACIGVWVAVTPRRWRRFVGFGLGALAAFAIFAWAHDAMFGSPFRTGHFFLASPHNIESQSGGFLGISGLYAGSLGDHLFSPYMGLVPMMPFLVVTGGWGIVRALRHGDGADRAIAAMPIVYLIFVCTLDKWRMMTGWSIGPRYLVPALLPLAYCAGRGWRDIEERAPSGVIGAVRGLAAAAVVIVLAVTVAYPSPPSDLQNTFADFALPLLREGYAVPTLASELGLEHGTLYPLVALAAIAIAWILWVPRRPLATFVGALLLVGWVGGLAQLDLTPPAAREAALSFARGSIEGETPQGLRPPP